MFGLPIKRIPRDPPFTIKRKLLQGPDETGFQEEECQMNIFSISIF
jgi:hypothetical protein